MIVCSSCILHGRLDRSRNTGNPKTKRRGKKGKEGTQILMYITTPSLIDYHHLSQLTIFRYKKLHCCRIDESALWCQYVRRLDWPVAVWSSTPPRSLGREPCSYCSMCSPSALDGYSLQPVIHVVVGIEWFNQSWVSSAKVTFPLVVSGWICNSTIWPHYRSKRVTCPVTLCWHIYVVLLAY
jgi:hypothetical protein